MRSASLIAFFTNRHAAGKISWFNSKTNTFLTEEVSAAWTTGEVFANANRNNRQVNKYDVFFRGVSNFQKYVYEAKLIDLMRNGFIMCLLIAVSFSMSAQTLPG